MGLIISLLFAASMTCFIAYTIALHRNCVALRRELRDEMRQRLLLLEQYDELAAEYDAVDGMRKDLLLAAIPPQRLKEMADKQKKNAKRRQQRKSKARKE